MNASMLDLLMLELEEEYAFDGSLPLYQVSWTLAGLGVERSDPTFAQLARQAYDAFRAEHPDLILARGSWPDLMATATPAPDEDDVDLDFDSTSDHGSPMLLLIHPGDVSSPGARPLG